jgi:cytochrome P450
MRPHILALLPKIVPEGGDELHGKSLPAGTAVCMNMSSLLRSPALFGPDADVFRPERFIELDQTRRSEMERNVELAFGYGHSMCLGKLVAIMELNKVIFEVNN